MCIRDSSTPLAPTHAHLPLGVNVPSRIAAYPLGAWRRRSPAGRSATELKRLRQGPLEAVEDGVEAVLELVAVVVARLQGVPHHLDKVGVRVEVERLSQALRHLGDLLPAVEREGHLRQREAIDIAVQER